MASTPRDNNNPDVHAALADLEVRVGIRRKRRKLPPAAIRQTRRQKVFARDGYRCVKCGSTEKLTEDHIRPRCRGGTNALSNLQTLCEPCNGAKGDFYVGDVYPGGEIPPPR